MPPATIRFIRAAWTWFAIGLALGGVLALAKVGWLPPSLLRLRATHVHLLAVGWAVQWVFGIAFWIYPGFGHERTGPAVERASRACWWLLNAGVVGRALSEALLDAGEGLAPAPVVFVASAAAEVAAGLVFLGLIRRRIRGARWIRDAAPTGDRS